MLLRLKQVRWSAWLLLVVLLCGSGTTYAEEADVSQKDIYDAGGYYYILNSGTPKCSNSLASGPVDVPAGQNSGAWTSGLNPPYILEQFMIELLKDIAHKRGVPESNAVTQQHIVGLLALAWGEGGGITSDYFWNPFHTGINATDLTVDGIHVGDGRQAFKSFDAGVEATARVMTGSTQGRLGVTLTDPSSTAMDFLNSWLDFPPHEPYLTGHSPWAAASDPSSDSYQPDYREKRIALINQTAIHYTDMASTIMRAQPSDPNNTHNTSQLKYTSAATTATNTTAACGIGTFFGTALAYAWPDYRQPPYCVMKPAYATAVQAALDRIRAGQNDYVGSGTAVSAGDCSVGSHAGIDCGGFVTRVFRDSGADPHYNPGTTVVVNVLNNYLLKHPELYQEVQGVEKTSDLKPGDIYITPTHTYIFMGIEGYPGYDSVSASTSESGRTWRTPMASNAYNLKTAHWFRPLYTLTGATHGAATNNTTTTN